MRHPESLFVLIKFDEDRRVRKDGKSGEKAELDREISSAYFKIISGSKRTLVNVLGVQVAYINPQLIQVRDETPTFILSFLTA
jgi:hypothetical protein